MYKIFNSFLFFYIQDWLFPVILSLVVKKRKLLEAVVQAFTSSEILHGVELILREKMAVYWANQPDRENL